MIEGGLAYLWPSCLAFLIAAGSPGPATLAVAATAMSGGRRSGLALGAGLAAGLSLWGVVAAAGLGTLVLHSAPALAALRIAGGLYLFWLALGSARAALSDLARPGRPIAMPGLAGLARRGLILNAMNPKAVLAWTAVLALGLPTGAGAAELWTITAVCAALGTGIYAVYAIIFSLPPVMAFYGRARRGIEAVLALAFGAAGARLILSRGETP